MMQSTISEVQAAPAEPQVSATQQAKRILATGDTVGTRAFVARALLETPDDEELRKFGDLIAPQQVRRVPSSPETAARIAANHRWLLENEDDYRGQWVVLKSGELVGSGEDLNKIRQRIGSFQGLFVTRVF